MDLNGKNILVTGGTGSFGKRFVKTVLNDFPGINRLVIFSRDELKQYEMAQVFPKSKFPCMRYFIGNIRDEKRVKRAFEGIDYVIHAAALKQVPTAEYNPMEYIKTNILGAQNVVDAALDCGVKKVVALSTDKAAAPINLYGATKLCSDKLFVAANNIRGSRDLTFSVVRYGNIIGSRGSVIPHFLKLKASGVLPITHPEMTRFNISLDDGIRQVLYALEHSWGGEIFVPKIPSFLITDLAKAICLSCAHKIIGLRPGEKIHEEMITTADSFNTVELDKYYVICPTSSFSWNKEEFCDKNNAKMVTPGFSYNSGTNVDWLNIEDLKQIINNFSEYIQ